MVFGNKNIRYEYKVKVIDLSGDAEVEVKINQLANPNWKLVSVTPTHVRKEKGPGKEVGYETTLSAQYIFERPLEDD